MYRLKADPKGHLFHLVPPDSTLLDLFIWFNWKRNLNQIETTIEVNQLVGIEFLSCSAQFCWWRIRNYSFCSSLGIILTFPSTLIAPIWQFSITRLGINWLRFLHERCPRGVENRGGEPKNSSSIDFSLSPTRRAKDYSPLNSSKSPT